MDENGPFVNDSPIEILMIKAMFVDQRVLKNTPASVYLYAIPICYTFIYPMYNIYIYTYTNLQGSAAVSSVVL